MTPFYCKGFALVAVPECISRCSNKIFHRLRKLDVVQEEGCWIPKRFSVGDIRQEGNGATPDNLNATLKRSIRARKSQLLTSYSTSIRDLCNREVVIVRSSWSWKDWCWTGFIGSSDVCASNSLPDQNSPINKSAIISTSVCDIGPAVAGHNFSMNLTKAEGVACGIMWNPIFSSNRRSKSTSWSLWKCGKFDCREVVMRWRLFSMASLTYSARNRNKKRDGKWSLTVQSGLISCIFVANITAEAAARLIICASVGDRGSHRDWKSNCVKKLSNIWILRSLVSTDEFDNRITYR